jgi:phosphatidylglycerol:prolipoprotein diacylglycerol transferase
MIAYPNFDPVAVAIGPIKIHWYGIMYLLGFWGGWWLALRRGRRDFSPFSSQALSDLLFYLVLGVILGGRIGYTFFYNLPKFLDNPLVIFRIWEGGMSFHGGLIGVLVAFALYARSRKLTFFYVADFIAPVIPVGLFTGRIGNFINAELWGGPTSLPWGMVFPTDPQQVPRHPSMLYEAFLEGIVMLCVLLWFSRKPRPPMAVSGLFLMLYGGFRWAVEFIREPDAHIGYLAWGWLTMGQVLCIPMLAAGATLLALAYRPNSRMPS